VAALSKVLSAVPRLLGLRVRIPKWTIDVCLSLLSFVCCQVEVSAWDWSLLQRNPTECECYECDREASTMRRPWPSTGCWVSKQRYSIHSVYRNYCFLTISVILVGFKIVRNILNYRSTLQIIQSNVTCVTLKQSLAYHLEHKVSIVTVNCMKWWVLHNSGSMESLYGRQQWNVRN